MEPPTAGRGARHALEMAAAQIAQSECGVEDVPPQVVQAAVAQAVTRFEEELLRRGLFLEDCLRPKRSSSLAGPAPPALRRTSPPRRPPPTEDAPQIRRRRRPVAATVDQHGGAACDDGVGSATAPGAPQRCGAPLIPPKSSHNEEPPPQGDTAASCPSTPADDARRLPKQAMQRCANWLGSVLTVALELLRQGMGLWVAGWQWLWQWTGQPAGEEGPKATAAPRWHPPSRQSTASRRQSSPAIGTGTSSPPGWPYRSAKQPTTPAAPLARQWEQHWAALERCRADTTPLGYAHIPWPDAGPEDNALLTWHLAQLRRQGLAVQRARLKALLLVWHPDKFRAWAGPRLAAADQERALQRLPGICQLLCAELQGAG
eukprot:EG_transcript_14554